MLTAICICLLMSVGLAFLLYEIYGGTDRQFYRCEECKIMCSQLTVSHEVANRKICHECAWEEHGRMYNAPWATRYHL